MPKSKHPNFSSGMLNSKKAYGYDIGGEVIDNGPTNIHDLTLLKTQPNPQEDTRDPASGTLDSKTKLYAPITVQEWQSDLDSLLVTTDLNLAKARAKDMADSEGKIPAVAVIRFGNLDGVELKPDPDYALIYRETSWQESYSNRSSFLISGDIKSLKSKFTLVPLN